MREYVGRRTARWSSGSLLDSYSRGRRFESYSRNNMKINFRHARHKYWEHGFFYLLPTLRFNWTRCDGINFCQMEDSNSYKIELLWLTFNIALEWEHAIHANGSSR